MSGAQKFSLSLLISVVVFSGFAVLAWSGLFDYIETTFYLDRVQASVQTRVDRITELVDEFHASNQAKFAAILNQPSVRRSFAVTQAREDIVERSQFFETLEAQIPSLDYVRFVDIGGSRLHFSTRPTDYTEAGTTRIYTPLATLDQNEPVPISELAYPEVEEESRSTLVGSGIPEPDLLLSDTQNQFIYRLPVLDELGVLKGAALFHVHTVGLNTWLVRDGLVGVGDIVDIIPSPEGGASGAVLANGQGQWSATLDDSIQAAWDDVTAGGRPVLAADEETAFILFSGVRSEPADYLTLYLFARSELQMTDIMKFVMLGAIFLTVFLVVFLVFNLRQDAVVVLSDRVKRFQISLLREFMENKQDLDFQRWRTELEDRRSEVAGQIRRGLGRIKPSQQEEVGKLIDSSWDEILDVLGSRAEQTTDRGIDLDRLEDIVERVIGNLQSAPVAAVGSAVRPAHQQPVTTGTPIEVEELTEEDLEDADDAEEVSELGTPVEVEELAEEDLEDADDAEEVSELGTPVEVEELTEEDLEEAGEAEEVAELGTPIEVEELTEEDLEDADDAEEVSELGTPIEVEELTEEDLEEAGEAEEVAELGTPIEVEELTEEDLEEAGEAEEVAELGTPVEVEELTEEDLEDADDAEEVAALGTPVEVEELTEEDLGEAGVAEEVSELGTPVEVEELSEEDLEHAGDAEEVAELGTPVEVEELTGGHLDEAGEVAVGEAEDAFGIGEPIEIEELDGSAIDYAHESRSAAELGAVTQGADAVDDEATIPLDEPGFEGSFGIGEPVEIEELSSTREAGSTGDEADIPGDGGLEEVGADEDLEELGEGDITEEAPAKPISGELDELTELQWLAESEPLDTSSVSLESLNPAASAAVPLLEGEQIEDASDDIAPVLEEVDLPEPLASADSGLVVPGSESGETAVPPAADIDGDLQEVADEPDDQAALELEGVRHGASPFVASTFSFGKGLSVGRSGISADDDIPDVEELEVEDFEPADAGEAEELEVLEEPGDLESVEMLEEPEEFEEPGELEEPDELLEPLEGADELIGESELVPAVALDGVAQLEAEKAAPLISEGPIRFTDIRSPVTDDYEIASIGDILDRLHIDKDVIVDQDGIVEIGRKVYDDDRRPGDEETRQLVDSVVGGEEETITAGVEQLFGGDSIDLFADLAPSEPAAESGTDSLRSVIRFVDQGFDYDGFLRGYNDSEGGVIKSIVTFTRHWGARVGVILAVGDGELVPRHGLGIDEECVNALHVSHSSGIYRNVLQKRLALLVQRPLRRVEYFHGLCPDEQLGLFQKALFLPVVFAGESGYLLLGLPDTIENLEDAFKPIVPLLTSLAAV